MGTAGTSGTEATVVLVANGCLGRRDHSHAPSKPMPTPPSTAHTVVQFEAGGAAASGTAAIVESGAALVTVDPAPGCAHAAGLPLKTSSRVSSNSHRPPGREKPAGSGWLLTPDWLVERLRVMEHLG